MSPDIASNRFKIGDGADCMASPKTPLELLKTTPITMLSIGRASFRRSVVQKGFDNILEVINLAVDEVNESFSLDDASVIKNLQQAFQSDPEGFAREALRKLENPQSISARAVRDESCRQHLPHSPRSAESPSIERGDAQIDPYSLLRLPFSLALLKREERAKQAFNDLDDRQESVIVYQCFDVFATEFEEINRDFQALFDRCAPRPKDSLVFIDRFLPNLFLVYVADRARTLHEHRGLWTNLFPLIHFSPAGPDTQAFKQLFYNSLKRKNMPVYQEDESARHYLLTALFHGGLSRSSWKALWETTLLPLARSYRSFGNGSQADIDGRMVLSTILDPTNAYTPPKTELELLGKAPVALAAPLLESALHVGIQVEQGGTGPTLLTSYGLPDVAIDALIDLQSEHAGSNQWNNGLGQSTRREILALPKADLQLDIERGRIALRWNKQRFPLSNSRRKINYLIDSVKMSEQHLHYGIDSCTLDAMCIDVAPRPQYEVALKLMELDELTDTWREIASLEQNFERLNPGCFEFIQDAEGSFRLRRPNERITKRRTIAYVLDKGLPIEPGPGMEFVERYVPQDTWNETTIDVYTVQPGSGGTIMMTRDDGSRERLATWQESYRSNIDKTYLLGTTLGGIDLYGFIPDENGNNIGLPSFYIEAFDGHVALDDLDVKCLCDGEAASIKREALWNDSEDDGAARIKLSPSRSGYFYLNKHIELCTIEARQRSADMRPVFTYKFCVIPIQDFHLESIALNGYELEASYAFEPSEAIEVIDRSHTVIPENEKRRFKFSRPLSSRALSIRIISSLTSKTTDAVIDLAALNISIPHHLIDRSRVRPLCLADAKSGYMEGLCGIEAGNWSQSRIVLVMLGNYPLYFRELSRPGTSCFSIFENIYRFLQIDGGRARDLPLSLRVYYGYKQSNTGLAPASAETILISCREGFGFTRWSLRCDRRGNSFIKLDAPLRSSVRATFSPAGACNTNRRVKTFTQTLDKGEDRIAIPPEIATALHRHRPYDMALTLIDEFDEFDDLFSDDQTNGDKSVDVSHGLTTTFTLKGAEHHGA